MNAEEQERKDCNHLPATTFTVKSLDDATSCTSREISGSIEALTEVKVGCLGNGMLVVLLSSITTTDAMFGL